MALTTSLNSTLLVPSRLALVLARDGLAPTWLGAIHPRTGTPVWGLTLTLALSVVLLVSGQLALALNSAVFALVLLYFLHSLNFLLLPRRNPSLMRMITVNLSPGLQRIAAWISLLAMGVLIGVQIWQDLQTLFSTSLQQRIANHSLTSVELVAAWGLIGLLLYAYTRRRRSETIKSVPRQ